MAEKSLANYAEYGKLGVEFANQKNVVHKIRPGLWYKEGKNNFPMFENLEDFISAIEETVYQNPATRNEAASWKKNFLKSYEKFYGVKLKIPRWTDISEKYQNKNK